MTREEETRGPRAVLAALFRQFSGDIHGYSAGCPISGRPKVPYVSPSVAAARDAYERDPPLRTERDRVAARQCAHAGLYESYDATSSS